MAAWLRLPWQRAWPTPAMADSDTTTEAPEPAPPAPAAAKGTGSKIVLVSVLGMRGEALIHVIETVTNECRQTRTRPLFVTDQDEFSPFRQRHSLFEQVVDVEICLARRPDLDWRSYAERQYRLIGRKWKPITTVAFGRKPDPAFVDAAMQGVREKL